MNRKQYVISSFFKFISEKYSQDELEDELESPDSKDDIKMESDDEVPTENGLKEDLLDIIQEYKRRYEK
jgi:hypothetical protein